MTKTIVFGNQKGGVGKSTCTILAAGTFSSAPFDLKVTVIDTDEQQTISILNEASRLNGDACKWEVISFPGEIKGVQRKKFDKILEKAKATSDLVLIDLPGHLDTDGKTANVSPEADFVFIPVPPTNKDVPSSEDYLNFMLNIRNIVLQEFDHDIRVVPFCNMHRRGHSSSSFVKDVFDDWKERYEVHPMTQMLGRYVEHEDVGVGNTLYGNINSTKGINYTKWIDEVATIIGIEK